jgi:hypothetical protein
MNRNKSFLLKIYFSQVLCHSDRMLTNATIQ